MGHRAGRDYDLGNPVQEGGRHIVAEAADQGLEIGQAHRLRTNLMVRRYV